MSASLPWLPELDPAFLMSGYPEAAPGRCQRALPSAVRPKTTPPPVSGRRRAWNLGW